MKRPMILAALLASIHAAGAEDAPSRSRIQDITKGARDLVPSMRAGIFRKLGCAAGPKCRGHSYLNELE